MNELMLVAMMMVFGGQQVHPAQQTLEGITIAQPHQTLEGDTSVICGGGDCGPNGMTDITCQAQDGGRLICSTISFGGVVIVPAVKITVPASRPCNLAPGGDSYGNVFSVCITGPETHTTCEDKRRVLLTSEDGQSFCLRLDLIGEKR